MNLFLHEFFWPVFGVTLMLICVVIWIWREHLQSKRQIALRELILKERIAAMEKGIPLPEWRAELLDDDNMTDRSRRMNIQWVKLASLGFGLILSFAGVGMMLAFELSSDSGLRQLTSIGVLPLMTGLGMILFYFMIRKVKVTED